MISPGISPKSPDAMQTSGLGTTILKIFVKQPKRSPRNMTEKPPTGPRMPPARKPNAALNESVMDGVTRMEMLLIPTHAAVKIARYAIFFEGERDTNAFVNIEKNLQKSSERSEE